MTAPISFSLLVKDDPAVFDAIASIREHVAEILVGWTPNEVVTERALLVAGATRVLELPGKLVDWAGARNRVMSYCSQPYYGWLDSDDTVWGADRLDDALAILEQHPLARVLCPYDYLSDERGRVTHRQVRERIVRNDGRFTWRYPCHETLVAKDGQYGDSEPRVDFIVWKHHRVEQKGSLAQQLEILQQYERDNPDDPWLLQNMGLTLYRMLRREEAIPYLERAVAANGDEDDRAQTMLVLARAEADIAHASGKTKSNRWERWARQAVELRPGCFETHYVLGLLLSMSAIVKRNDDIAREALDEFDLAKACPHVDHRLGVALSDRDKIHMGESAMYELLGEKGLALAALEKYAEAAEDTADLRVARRQLAAAVELEARDSRVIDEGVTLEAREVDSAEFRRAYLEKLSGGQWYETVTRHLDIIFACGRAATPWNPAIVDERGFGGSETMVVEMARRLRAKGHRVRVYCSSDGSGIYDGVEYHDMATLDRNEKPECDVLIAWRLAPALDFADARARLLWVHDIVAINATEELLAKADRILALSEWHKLNIIEQHKVAPEMVHVTRNAIDLTRFLNPVSDFVQNADSSWAEPVRRNPHVAIYSSSFDRGLPVLLDLWPKVRERVPDAELRVFYGLDQWKADAERIGQTQRYLVRDVEKKLEQPGVVYRGRVPGRDLAREMLGAGVWTSPHWFSETSCLSVMEAQAAGLRVVTTAVAALPETVGDHGVLVEGDWLDPEFQETYVQKIVSAMNTLDGDWIATREEIAHSARQRFGFDDLVEQWQSLFANLLGGGDSDELPPYIPDPEWAAGVQSGEIVI